MPCLPDTSPLEFTDEIPAAMVAGIHRYLLRETSAAPARRERHWAMDFASREAYAASVAPNRERFRKMIGAVDPRPERVDMQLVSTTDEPSLIASTDAYEVHAVRWQAAEGFTGEGLLLRPTGDPIARVIALPDCDAVLDRELPARNAVRLAAAGCEVIVPVLIDRDDEFSGHPNVRYTNQPHREFVYRMAFEMGRHVIGYEVVKVMAAVDWCKAQDDLPVAVMGHGEGGLIALYAAACDERIDAACVSGYFGPREDLHLEPIYRNVFGLLDEFGDAEIARLIAPRPLIIEASDHPDVTGPPEPRDGRTGAAPGRIQTPPFAAVEAEVARARVVYENLDASAALQLTTDDATDSLLASLGLPAAGGAEYEVAQQPTYPARAVRMKRQVEELCAWTQEVLRRSEPSRDAIFADVDMSTLDAYRESTAPIRDFFWEEVIGKLPPATEPMNPRSRLVYDEPDWTGYEVILDVYPDVFASGILLLPKDLRPGEKRPVVVCQHGLEGTPQKTIDSGEDHYNEYAARLCRRGFITYAPQNPYVGGDAFRALQRLLNPLGKSLFSIIARQHERALEWLSSLKCADATRIGFYGLSYGGVSAMRLPALLEQYACSICSANFNDWALKVAGWDHPFGYVFTGEFEMPEFDLGHALNYAEMAALIAPALSWLSGVIKMASPPTKSLLASTRGSAATTVVSESPIAPRSSTSPAAMTSTPRVRSPSCTVTSTGRRKSNSRRTSPVIAPPASPPSLGHT